MELKDKIALVTGGDRGIGRAIVLELAKRGCNVIINYHRNSSEAERTKRDAESYRVRAWLLRFDVSNRQEVRRALSSLSSKIDEINVLINNAGILGDHFTLEEIDDEEWDRVININLKGAFIMTQEVLKYMKRGKIVNISSIVGRNGGTVGVHYAASKAGLIGLTFSLARQLAPNILVNAVAPGPVDTSLIPEEKKKSLRKLSLLDRIASPEEIAHAVIFLIENDYITGSVVNMNGGRYML
ncbi:MAG: 3-oxoacyl-ACP reductase FabG [Thermoplasmata archaeon]|nr:3-oxoacyl-ACP reductase FabG [Thermoplasmata archaeon]